MAEGDAASFSYLYLPVEFAAQLVNSFPVGSSKRRWPGRMASWSALIGAETRSAPPWRRILICALSTARPPCAGLCLLMQRLRVRRWLRLKVTPRSVFRTCCGIRSVASLLGLGRSGSERLHCRWADSRWGTPGSDQLGIIPSSVSIRIDADVKAVSTNLHLATRFDQPFRKKSSKTTGIKPFHNATLILA